MHFHNIYISAYCHYTLRKIDFHSYKRNTNERCQCLATDTKYTPHCDAISLKLQEIGLRSCLRGCALNSQNNYNNNRSTDTGNQIRWQVLIYIIYGSYSRRVYNIFWWYIFLYYVCTQFSLTHILCFTSVWPPRKLHS